MKLESHALAVISGYEFLALISRSRVPTLTAHVMRLPVHKRRVLVALAAFWLIRHFELREKPFR